MRAIAIVGWKKSGKTTLGLALVEALARRGLRVAAVKHASHGFDRADRDTARYMEHCACVCGVGPEETFAAWPRERGLDVLAPLLGADVVVVEGGRDRFVAPRIIMGSAEGAGDGGPGDLAPELALATVGCDLPGVPRVEDPDALAALAAERGFLLPGLDCGACGRDDCRAMAADIVAGRAAPGDCPTSGAALRITANGRAIAANPFVERIIRATILGMLGELKGFEPGPVRIELDG
ncbi:MAG: molybdopterin-guanine dinucleotide biosynthesis protein MobB [Desulfovibrionaceae bacterium]|nr:molybdopterin-guanine dinucleotide biosynthesis protein MobB [Desulfovibrionaceae bacterium]